MRVAAMLAMAAMLRTSALAEQSVQVSMDNHAAPGRILDEAERTAAGMFSAAAVRIDWQRHMPDGRQLPAREIAVSMAAHTPVDYLPGALASAKAYEGAHITVFWDRIERPARPAPTAVILAHVLVHEITHILQGIDRHSDSGIMKAPWTTKDYVDMAWRPLGFTPRDIVLIRHGLDERASQPASSEFAAR